MSCTGDAYPMATAQWDKPLETEFKFFGSPLTISSFKPSDEGEYICELRNGVEPNAKRRIRVRGQANDKPNILKPTTDSVSVSQGDDLTINCQCELCQPLDTMMWIQEDDQQNWYEHTSMKNIISDEQGNRMNYELALKQVSPSKNGVYTCNLQNEFGADEFKIRVNVKKPLNIEQTGKDSSQHRCIMNKHVNSIEFDTESADSKIASNVYDCNLFDREHADVAVVLMGNSII